MRGRSRRRRHCPGCTVLRRGRARPGSSWLPLLSCSQRRQRRAAPGGPRQVGRGKDKSRAAFLMIRARHPADGKRRYLLQRRPDGDWGLPGGSAHVGEDGSINRGPGELPRRSATCPPLASRWPSPAPGDGKMVTVHLHEVPFSSQDQRADPRGNAGVGWFSRREVGDLDLHPPFRDAVGEHADWQHRQEPPADGQRGRGSFRPHPRPHSASRRRVAVALPAQAQRRHGRP